ncbi:phosphoribosylglycinamide formyltransferase [Francisellaceae bacterium]|nr:phosphoribosylglycinamide formyltransferase [Francisellaceae bacterium]
MPKKIVVLCSGSGTNLQAIIDAIQAEKINAVISAVITNKPCYALDRAEKNNIPKHLVPSKAYPSRELFDKELIEHIDQYQPDFIILAGFMRILTSGFVQHYHDKLINIHPALLPKYKGLHTHKRALEAGDKEHGSSVHNVTEGVDDGAVIAQSKIKLHSNDSIPCIEQRIKKIEHTLYPEAISLLCSGKITINKNTIYYLGEKLAAPLLI